MPPITPARRADLSAVGHVLFRHLAPEEQVARALNFRAALDAGELDPAGVLVARCGAGIAGAMLAAPLPGSGGVVWPPQVAPNHPASVADELVQSAAEFLRGRGCRMAQALLSEDDVPFAGALERNGFPFLTRLEYHRHDLDLPTDVLATPERLTYAPFDGCDPARFGDVLLRTYEGTLDCPEINGVRSAAEVLAGHKGGGDFDPRRWWLASADGESVGVLLTNAQPEGDWDVAYVGVEPAARRRGFGRELMAKALWEAKAGGAAFVSLAVDVRNEPARRLYRRLGFKPVDERAVYLAVWND
jgi:GNAT superfamily N-acetyltransferase